MRNDHPSIKKPLAERIFQTQYETEEEFNFHAILSQDVFPICDVRIRHPCSAYSLKACFGFGNKAFSSILRCIGQG